LLRLVADSFLILYLLCPLYISLKLCLFGAVPVLLLHSDSVHRSS